MDANAAIADAISRSPTGALNDPNILREDSPPSLRFERKALEDRHMTIERGVYTHMDAIVVHVKSYGDLRTEVPYVVQTSIWVPTETEVSVRKSVPVILREVVDGEVVEKTIHEQRDTMETQQTWKQEEIYPWFETLADKLRNGFITQSYSDHCHRVFEVWKEKGDVPLDGFPVIEWNMISPAQQRTLVDCEMNTVELVAEMGEDVMERVGMGARDLKKKASAWLNANTDTAQQAANMMALQEEVDNNGKLFSAYEQKIAELNDRIAAMEEPEAE